MANPKSQRTTLIGLVHMAAKQCGQDEDARRDFLETLTGKRSSADCSIGELERVVQAYTDRYGWRRLMASSSRSARYGRLWLRSMRSIILQMKA